jgi:RimJ/RimL family protein N-acetyltransferase
VGRGRGDQAARLQLRGWREHDLAPFASLNADPRVAVEAPGVADSIGFVGLSIPRFQAHFMPCVEIGWRLAHEYWGRGYATEAARATLTFGFRDLALDEIVSFTVPSNWRSRGSWNALA